MMPEMQVSEKEVLQRENDGLYQTLRERDYRILMLERTLKAAGELPDKWKEEVKNEADLKAWVDDCANELQAILDK